MVTVDAAATSTHVISSFAASAGTTGRGEAGVRGGGGTLVGL
jgi:hypothetical protein